MSDPAVTIITITRSRPELLQRAMASVADQNYDEVRHVIYVDDCQETAGILRDLERSGKLAVSWQLVGRSESVVSGPARVAFLRNLAVREADTEFIAYLDDDNELTPDHISSLVRCAIETGCPAVHSQRWMFWPDGRPYLEEETPWMRSVEERRASYQELRDRGVFVPGSNIVRDRVDPPGTKDPVRMVDLGEWLFGRTLLLEYPFPETYDHSDWLNVVPEDNKLLKLLVADQVPIAGTGLPTLRYYLGGYSNAFAESSGTGAGWHTNQQRQTNQANG